MNNYDKLVDESLDEFLSFWQKIDPSVAEHNKGIEAFLKEPKKSFSYQLPRYKKLLPIIVDLAQKENLQSISDFGTFSGVFDVCLARLGFKVSAVEKYSLYDGGLDPIQEFLTKNKCTVIDKDSVLDKLDLEKSDLGISMAVIEHLIGSPKNYLDNIKANTKSFVFIEVPNLATLYKRVRFLLKGDGIFDEYSDYFYSNYPYFGHNKEYIKKELDFIASYLGESCGGGG